MDWGSKRQTVVAKSTTEAETVANNEMMRRILIPCGSIFSAIHGVPLKEDAVTDNEASRLIIMSGAGRARKTLPAGLSRLSVGAAGSPETNAQLTWEGLS